jgi:hypothetical protein
MPNTKLIFNKMIELLKWGDYLFEIYDKVSASQLKGEGVLIVALREKPFLTKTLTKSKWTAVYIEETHSFSTLNSDHLTKILTEAEKFGEVYIHTFKAANNQRNLIARKLIEIYKPAVNESETFQTNELQKEDMTIDTQPVGPLVETKQKLDLLFQYEKHYLELIKEFKEEIKFANTMQEDLRREKTQFLPKLLKKLFKQ